MIEMVAVLVIIGTLIGLLLPAVQSSREMARRVSCSNNLTQIALAVRAYHVSFDQLPAPLSGTDGSATQNLDNDRRLSILVAILPMIDEAALWESIHSNHPRDVDEYFDSYGMGMMPYEEDGAIESLSEDAESEVEGETKAPWVAGGPEPFEMRYAPWRHDVPRYRCPSDPGIGDQGRTNYAICLGDGVIGSETGPFKLVKGRFVYDAKLAAQCDASMRGVFVPRTVVRLDAVTDGLANTIMLGEIASDLGDLDIRTRAAAGPGDPLRDDPQWVRENDLIDLERPRFWRSAGTKLQSTPDWGRGLRWADGMPLYTAFNTILPPNREIAMRADCDDCWGILAPSSRHEGGVNLAMADGSVRFMTDTIDAGDSRAATVYIGSVNPPESQSPFGLWGALGTRSSGELQWLPE